MPWFLIIIGLISDHLGKLTFLTASILVSTGIGLRQDFISGMIVFGICLMFLAGMIAMRDW